MKIVTILGTRPEIVKLSALLPLLDQNFTHVLVHTGQHYDYNLDQVFFEELHLKEPNYSLNTGSHPQGRQTGRMLEKIEEVLLLEKPDLVIVQGDTNTTLSGSLAAAKLHIPLLHVESGCRSFNRRMPEEINRIVADHVSDCLIAPDQKSVNNLLQEGIPEGKIYPFGNTSFEAVVRNKEFIRQKEVLNSLGLEKGNYVLATIHRAENTDNPENLQNLISALNQLSEQILFVFPLHPRTKKLLERNGIPLSSKIKVIEPQPYLSFLALLSGCRLCFSDSGGIQEEALVFNVPCLIPRNETEWIRLVQAGKNFLLGTNPENLISSVKKIYFDQEEQEKIKQIPCPYETDVSEKILALIKKMERGGCD